MPGRLHHAVLLCAAVAIGPATAAFGKPAVWALPPSDNGGQNLREMLQHPDEWAQARSRIDVLAFADHALAKDFSDDELKRAFAQFQAWGLKVGLEVGAIKHWGPTGDQAFARGHINWDRFIADGARISAIAMDEPLIVSEKVLGQTEDYAVVETAKFIAHVRQTYPGFAIGDIEPYPGLSGPALLSFIDALQTRLRQMKVRGLDFFRLDVNWMLFRSGDLAGERGWEGVRAVEDECHRRGIPFGLIYWAADFPMLNRQGLATEDSWEQGIMSEGASYAAVGGVPDQYVIESWVHTPTHATPESEPGTFMHSVLRFTQQFVPGSRPR